MAIGFQAEVKKPLRLLFFGRYEAYHILIESDRNDVGVNVADKSVFVFSGCSVGDYIVVVFFHDVLFLVMSFRI